MGGFFHATTAPTGGSREPRRTRLVPGMCWRPNDNGSAATRRRLRQRTRHLTFTIEQEFRFNVWFKSERAMMGVDREHARLVVLHTARCKSEDTLVSFGEALDVVLDTLEREQRAGLVQQLRGAS